MTGNRHKGTLGDKGSVPYLDCGDGDTCVHIFQNSSNCTLKMGTIFICKLS